MRVYIKKSLLEDAAQIETWAQHRIGTINDLHKLNERYLYLKNQRREMQTRVDEAKVQLDRVSVSIPQRVWSDNPDMRRWQEAEAEKEHQAQLERARKPIREKIEQLEAELKAWAAKYGSELISLGEQIAERESVLRELEAKLSPFICIEADKIIPS